MTQVLRQMPVLTTSLGNGMNIVVTAYQVGNLKRESVSVEVSSNTDIGDVSSTPFLQLVRGVELILESLRKAHALRAVEALAAQHVDAVWTPWSEYDVGGPIIPTGERCSGETMAIVARIFDSPAFADDDNGKKPWLASYVKSWWVLSLLFLFVKLLLTKDLIPFFRGTTSLRFHFFSHISAIKALRIRQKARSAA